MYFREGKKVVGGTKGNVILEFVSAAPNKAQEIETSSQAFDYDELTKYGYSKLVTPIMKAGGRLVMYDLLGLEQPPITSKPKPKSAPKLTIDRTGENDRARYSGLKLGQVLDDSMQAAALQEAEQKVKTGEPLRPKLQEETFERPFADRRNVGPQMVPDWTPERLDEWGKQQGKSIAWARRAREGEFVGDPLETLDLELPQRAYSILTGLCVAFSFGKSTTTVLSQFDGDLSFLLQASQVPAAALLLSAFGSGIFSAFQASGKNRNAAIWLVKGFLGGPLTVRQLRGLPDLQTRGDQNK